MGRLLNANAFRREVQRLLSAETFFMDQRVQKQRMFMAGQKFLGGVDLSADKLARKDEVRGGVLGGHCDHLLRFGKPNRNPFWQWDQEGNIGSIPNLNFPQPLLNPRSIEANIFRQRFDNIRPVETKQRNSFVYIAFQFCAEKLRKREAVFAALSLLGVCQDDGPDQGADGANGANPGAPVWRLKPQLDGSFKNKKSSDSYRAKSESDPTKQFNRAHTNVCFHAERIS